MKILALCKRKETWGNWRNYKNMSHLGLYRTSKKNRNRKVQSVAARKVYIKEKTTTIPNRVPNPQQEFNEGILTK